MLKIFRKIRQKLLAEGALKKYLVYAVSEIFLVVIGILIALQLNNWNEQRKSEQAFDQLLEAFAGDLYETISESSYLIQSTNRRLNAIQLIRKGEVSREMYETNVLPRNIIVPMRLDVSSEDANILLEKQDQFPSGYNTLIPQLKQYLKVLDRQKRAEADLNLIVNQFMEFLTTHTKWPGQDGIWGQPALSQTRIDFYMNDPIYLNHLAVYEGTLADNKRQSTGIRAAAIALLVEIKRIREAYSIQQIELLIQELGLNPFQELSCESNPELELQEVIGLGYFLFINLLEEGVNLSLLDENQDKRRSIQLQPNEITTPFGKISDSGAEFRIREGELLEVWNQQGCYHRYVASLNGYLIIRN